MNGSWKAAAWAAHFIFERVAFFLICTATLGLLGYTAAAAAGLAPWLVLPLQFGPYVFPGAGIAVQTGLCLLMLSVCTFLPGIRRIMRLEESHRSFHIGMKDVARAYHAAHAADRDGIFTLSSEFDSVRERIAFLRAHPDLDGLESGVMEVAAQMSHLSRELARTYSDASVQRARDFLTQRQQEIEDFSGRIEEAKVVATGLQRWARRVELEEDVARSQLARLREDLAEVLPELAELAVGAAAEGPGAATKKLPTGTDGDWHTEPAPWQEPEAFDDDGRIVALLSSRQKA